MTAYKIILDPSTANRYAEQHNYFKYLKSNLQKEIQKDPSKYPLAHILIKLHDSCSEYGSHADISSFFHRMEVEELSEANADMVQIHYFHEELQSTNSISY